MDEIMNRIGEVYEPFKVHFLHKPVRPLAPDEVLVKVRASAICGSDLHIARGLHPSAPLPVTIGHEFSGDVVAIGSEVTKARLGERVAVEPCIVCGKCDACRHGQYGYCEHISFTYRNGDCWRISAAAMWASTTTPTTPAWRRRTCLLRWKRR